MQIFQTPICNLDFFNFLDTICLRTDKYFLFDNNAFKKMVYQNSYPELKEIKFMLGLKDSELINIIREIVVNYNVDS